jgi:thiol:disulfide interchange protein DsbC
MKKNLEVLITGILCSFLSVSVALALTPEESLKKNFPAIPVDSMTPSKIPGLYEVIAGQQIFYYAPEAEAIIGGPIVMKGGKNLTEEKYQALEQKRLSAMAQKIKDIPLEKALKIGHGKNTVIEITDPDCTFCRRAAEFFKGRTDVTKYIFFFPLAMHKDAEPKVRHILCAKDRAKAYDDAMSGKLDDMKLKTCNDSAVEALIKVHRETATKIGVTGTPLFIINGQPVVGANIPQIEKLLGGNK